MKKLKCKIVNLKEKKKQKEKEKVDWIEKQKRFYNDNQERMLVRKENTWI